MHDYTEQISRGAALLDQHKPGWEKRIDLERFDIASLDSCLLGQLYGFYFEGLVSLGLNRGAEHGFSLRWEDSSDQTYAELTEQWKAFITARLAEEVADIELVRAFRYYVTRPQELAALSAEEFHQLLQPTQEREHYAPVYVLPVTQAEQETELSLA